VSFTVAAGSYDRFMGAYARPLSVELADLAGVQAGQRALDVGCGPGALTRELVSRLGPSAVSAIDPSEPFVRAVRARLPGVDVRRAQAESVPFEDACFDVALAQLVVHFMADPRAGLAEMARVTRPGGVVAACVWDHGGGRGPLSVFWQAVTDLDPAASDESELAGARDGQLVRIFEDAGLREVRPATLAVRVHFESVEAWWEPFTLGVGPAGAHVATLDERARTELREHCRDLLPDGGFEIEASAWAATGRR
jgi:SAM-dependent methyltransferase